jgi:hypothetical protein
MADYLSRPPKFANPALEGEQAGGSTVEDSTRLNRLNLQAIIEHMAHNEPLPFNLSRKWIARHFALHDGQLRKVVTHSKAPGDPPHAA